MFGLLFSPTAAAIPIDLTLLDGFLAQQSYLLGTIPALSLYLQVAYM
jgi:hypothetical protein